MLGSSRRLRSATSPQAAVLARASRARRIYGFVRDEIHVGYNVMDDWSFGVGSGAHILVASLLEAALRAAEGNADE